ncbi:O-antigen ligase family protein, partial [Bacillus cereus]
MVLRKIESNVKLQVNVIDRNRVMNKIIVGSVFFFSYFLIMGNKFNNIYVYPSALICFIYIMYTLFNLL